MNTGLGAEQNGNGVASRAGETTIAGAIRDFLFFWSAVLFALCVSITLLRFAGFQWFVETPAGLGEVYSWSLLTYIGIKEAHKAQCGNGNGDCGIFQRKPGELFFVAWCSVVFALFLLTSFHVGQKEALDEILPTFKNVWMFFMGNEAIRFRDKIISGIGSTVTTISASLPAKTKGNGSAPPPVAPTA